MLRITEIIWRNALLTLLIVLIWATASKCFPNDCMVLKDRGYRCKNGTEPKVAFYFDNETEQCLSFLYEGCGGNENRFSNFEACRISCIPQDYGWCAMKGKAYGDNDSSTVICSGPASDPCPEKFPLIIPRPIRPKPTQLMEIETAEMFAKNFNPSCTKGKLVKLDGGGDFSMTLLGKSCSDKFCPKNSECFQQEIFAYCCQ
uniref:BPTI/Kunitz inhibitor domain-containing protein n=1 Tax=Setaria digitata TaxID=48799 RepID=A0A915PS72_9BILA